jgi:hypothetical protein
MGKDTENKLARENICCLDTFRTSPSVYHRQDRYACKDKAHSAMHTHSHMNRSWTFALMVMAGYGQGDDPRGSQRAKASSCQEGSGVDE